MWRARGFGLRDAFADILCGMQSAEELMDYVEVETPTGTVEVAMPRRRSEVAQGEVVPTNDPGAAAVAEAAKVVEAVPVPEVKETPKEPAPALSGDVYVGIVDSIYPAWKGKVDGKDAELFVIKTVDGNS